jgi:alanyl-tRNA synthetase
VRQLALVEEAKGEWSRKYFALRAETLPDNQRVCVLFEDNLTPFELKQFAMQLMQSGKAEVYAVLSAKTGEGDRAEYAYAIASQTVILRDTIKELNRVLNGRGGGRDIVQGTFVADEETIRRALEASFY